MDRLIQQLLDQRFDILRVFLDRYGSLADTASVAEFDALKNAANVFMANLKEHIETAGAAVSAYYAAPTDDAAEAAAAQGLETPPTGPVAPFIENAVKLVRDLRRLADLIHSMAALKYEFKRVPESRECVHETLRDIIEGHIRCTLDYIRKQRITPEDFAKSTRHCLTQGSRVGMTLDLAFPPLK